MIGHDYSRILCDTCVYHRKLSDDSFIYLLLYVNDIMIVARDIVEINRLKAQLNSEFGIKVLGAAKMILGMEIHMNMRE